MQCSTFTRKPDKKMKRLRAAFGLPIFILKEGG